MAFTKVFLIGICLISTKLSAGQSTKSIECKQASKVFHSALIENDSIALDSMLHDSLSYGHSNAWVENKSTLIQNNLNHVLTYQSIALLNNATEFQLNQISFLRFHCEIHYLLNASTVSEKTLRFAVLEVWDKSTGYCKLIARQSTLLP